MSGSSVSRRSASGAGSRPWDSEDRPRAIHDRARMAGGVHREPASRAQWAAGGEHLAGLLREVHGLLVAEPEPHAGDVVYRLFLGFRGLACDQNEHLTRLVVAEAHLSNLPFGLTRLGGDVASKVARLRLGRLEALGLEHLVKPGHQRLDLGFLAGQGQGSAGARGEQKKLASTGLADGGYGDEVDRVEL